MESWKYNRSCIAITPASSIPTVGTVTIELQMMQILMV
jgi:hypothetical protein